MPALTDRSDNLRQNMSDEAVKTFIQHLAEYIVSEDLIPELLEGESDAPKENDD